MKAEYTTFIYLTALILSVAFINTASIQGIHMGGANNEPNFQPSNKLGGYSNPRKPTKAVEDIFKTVEATIREKVVDDGKIKLLTYQVQNVAGRNYKITFTLGQYKYRVVVFKPLKKTQPNVIKSLELLIYVE